jgi:hypothetical protein
MRREGDPYETFQQLVERAEAIAEARLLRVVTEAAKHDPGYALKLLERRFPERWARRVSGSRLHPRAHCPRGASTRSRAILRCEHLIGRRRGLLMEWFRGKVGRGRGSVLSTLMRTRGVTSDASGDGAVRLPVCRRLGSRSNSTLPRIS